MTAPWRRAFELLPREHGFEPLSVEGRLPADLRGTLYRVGPGSFAAGAEQFGHWFDGDGVVTAVRLSGEAAEGACRFVDSRERAVEQRLGRRAFRGFGTPAAHPAAARVKRPLNVGAMRWGGGVYALGEGARPHAVDEATLRTRGESDLGGALQSAFAAHPHRVEARRAAYNFGVRYGRTFALDVIELPDDAGPARLLCTVPMRSPRYLHDFAVTNRRAVFLLAPLEADVEALLDGSSSVASAYRWRADHATEVLTVDLDPPHRASWTEVDPFFAWHLAGAVELGGDALAIEAIRYDDFSSSNAWYAALPYGEPSAAPRGELVRLVGSRVERLADASCELPVTSGEEVFAVAHSASASTGPHDALVAIDRRGRGERWFSLGAGRFPSGEPCVVGERHLLTLAYDSGTHRTGLLVLDRHDPGAGVIAAAWFDHHIPPAFHGVWAPGE